jgi:hypothetical protein
VERARTINILRGSQPPADASCCRMRRHSTWAPARPRTEWTEMRRYIGLVILAKSRLTVIETEPEELAP